MHSSRVLFQPGWKLQKATTLREDLITGNPIAVEHEPVEGTGLVQEALWSGVSETTSTGGVRDERIVMFAPTNQPVSGIDITASDEFIAPDEKVWQAITDGFPRGIPGQEPEYIAVKVRRAKEKE